MLFRNLFLNLLRKNWKVKRKLKKERERGFWKEVVGKWKRNENLPQFLSSVPSPQSFSLSHSHLLGTHCPFPQVTSVEPQVFSTNFQFKNKMLTWVYLMYMFSTVSLFSNFLTITTT